MLGRRVAEQALATGCPLTIVGNNPRPYQGLHLNFIADLLPGFGPLSGLHAAISDSLADYIYLIACDMPGFSNSWFGELCCRADANPQLDAILALVNERPEPFHALYSRRLLPVIESRISAYAHSGRKLSFARALEGVNCCYIPEVDSNALTEAGSIFCGINTPEEACRLQREYLTRRH